jgi:hypothetical protein
LSTAFADPTAEAGPSIEMSNVTQTIAKSRESECLVESRALQLRLVPLSRANWLTVIVPALISAFAGAAILRGAWKPEWMYVVGGATLIASLLVVVHKALNCDAYQTEANRMRRSYDALAVRYRTVYDINPPDAEARLIALDESLAALKESGAATVPDRYRVRAQSLLSCGTSSTIKA